MKLIGFFLIALSLVLGAISATTAYLPRLDLADDQLVDLVLNADAGRRTLPDGAVAPIAREDEPLTLDRLEALRAGGVQRVQVQEFAWRRWSGRWGFLLAAGGLIGGAMLVRGQARAARRREDRGTTPGRSASEVIEACCQTTGNLLGQIETLNEDAALDAIVKQFGAIQNQQVPALIEGRPELEARLGLGGYAEFMDQFAAAERQINRAWAAAADAHLPEARRAAGEADRLCRRARDKLEELLTPARRA